jgi:5S rRNA maturation endonuclease (ribonuclease M5)
MADRSLVNIISDIKEESYDSVILVEGKRDKEALKKAGISDYAIIEVSYKNPNQIYNELMQYNRKKVIALYDNDKTGEHKVSKLKDFLYGMSIKLLDYRNSLNKLGITYIEEIDNRMGL